MVTSQLKVFTKLSAMKYVAKVTSC